MSDFDFPTVNASELELDTATSEKFAEENPQTSAWLFRNIAKIKDFMDAYNVNFTKAKDQLGAPDPLPQYYNFGRLSQVFVDAKGISWASDTGALKITGTVSLEEFDTGDLAEGANLYYTEMRIVSLIQDGVGIAWAHPADGQLVGNLDFTTFTTDDIQEGSTNLFFHEISGAVISDPDDLTHVFMNSRANWYPYDTLDEDNAYMNTFHLHNDGRTITGLANGGTFRSILGYTTQGGGKFYFEAKIGRVGSTVPIIGIAEPLSANIATYAGGTATSFGYAADGHTYNNAVGTVVASLAANDIVGVAVDFAGGTVDFYKNNALVHSYTGLTLGLSNIALSMDGTNPGKCTLRTQLDQFTYSPPSGYVQWSL